MIEISLKNVKIIVEFGFLAMAALVFIFASSHSNLFMLAVASCAVHEIGHMFFMLILGEKLSLIRFHAAGIQIKACRNTLRPYFHDAAIILGGPTFNLITALALYSVNPLITHLQVFASMNLILGLFNLMPFSNFDGGTFILSVAEYLNADISKTKKILRFVNCLITVSIFMLMLTNGFYNITLFITLIYLAFAEIIRD